jgi:hypothetical protein
MKTQYILGIAIVIAISAGIVIAVVPPPPVNQFLGMPDTTFVSFTEQECRECHTATGTAVGEISNNNSVPDRHHLLAAPPTSFQCMDCHPVTTDPDGSQNITITRECVECHLESPHHETEDALNRHCSECHGSLVDDFDDGHYIPAYPPSMVTPDTSFKSENTTTGNKLGGCEACHEENETNTPPIMQNRDTHHNLGNVSGNCSICHFGDEFLNIRQCETCHGVKSLHSIQYDYANTTGMPGYGHIGENWDCNGCHAFWDAMAVMDVPIIPTLSTVSADSLVAGQPTVLRLEGTNFANTTTDNTSEVVVTDGVNPVNLTPDSITSSEIIVTIPPLDVGTYGLYVVKDDLKSKLVPIVVTPDVTITSAVKDGDNVIITGTGLGDQLPEPFDTLVSVTIIGGEKTVELPTGIVSWSDTLIVVSCIDAANGDLVTVNALFGSASTEITEGSDIP